MLVGRGTRCGERRTLRSRASLTIAVVFVAAVGTAIPARAATVPDPINTGCAATGACWSVMPGSPPGTDASPRKVSCASTTWCMAVGYFSDGSGYSKALAERWDGVAWSRLPTPDLPHPPGTAPLDVSPTDVSCFSENSCMAVGYTWSGWSGYAPLAEVWDGSTWSVTAVPASSTGTFEGVSCTSATFCAAVGRQRAQGATSNQTLAAVWDGSSWVITPTVDKGYDSDLLAVSCVSATTCVAIGRYSRYPSFPMLAEAWDGSAWSSMPEPPEPLAMWAVSCAAADDCTAVGGAPNDNTHTYTAAGTHWDGRSWTTALTTPDPLEGSELYSVQCAPSRRCIAVGSGTTGIPDQGGLARKWDGSRWSFMTTANPVGPTGTARTVGFLGVSCPSPTFCIAVGTYDGHFLAEQYGNPSGVSI